MTAKVLCEIVRGTLTQGFEWLQKKTQKTKNNACNLRKNVYNRYC